MTVYSVGRSVLLDFCTGAPCVNESTKTYITATDDMQELKKQHMQFPYSFAFLPYM